MSLDTVTDIQTRVRRLFGDASGVQIVDSDIINWCADALDEIANQISDLYVISVAQNVTTTSGIFTLPADCIDVKAVFYIPVAGGTTYPLRFVSMTELQQLVPGYVGNPNSDYSTGIPVIYTVGFTTAGSRNVIIWPISDTTVAGGLVIYYSRTPTKPTTLNSILEVPNFLKQAVFDFVMSRCYEQDEDWDSADRKARSFQDAVNTYGQRIKEGTVYPSIVPVVGDYSD